MTTSYVSTFDMAESANFQKGCFVAAWMVAQDIISDVNASAQRKAWATRVVQDKMTITARQLAFQALRDSAVRAAGVNATDEQFLSAILSRLDDLVAIG